MENSIYPKTGAEVARKRRELAPKPLDAFKAFSASVFADLNKSLVSWSLAFRAFVLPCPL